MLSINRRQHQSNVNASATGFVSRGLYSRPYFLSASFLWFSLTITTVRKEVENLLADVVLFSSRMYAFSVCIQVRMSTGYGAAPNLLYRFCLLLAEL